MKVMGDGGGAGAAIGPVSNPVDRAVQALRAVDQAIAVVLRALAEAGPVAGMPATRLISLQATATGWDVRYLARAAQTLSAMPRVWAAFDARRISWSQVRGITEAAKRLAVADRAALDGLLLGAIAQNATSEPDRLVEVAQDHAGRLDDAAVAAREQADSVASYVRLRPRLFGGADLDGFMDDEGAACLSEALDAAADAPVADGSNAVDADGRPIPASWRTPTSRAHQLAEGLYRLARAYLAGGPALDDTAAADDTDGDGADDAAAPPTQSGPGRARPAKPTAMVVVDLQTFIDDDADHGAGTITNRLLWRLAGGRRPLSTARAHAMSCDAMRVPVLVDGDVVLAVGDAHDDIPLSIRRAAMVRDQGCRFPGCDRPQQFTDLHHVVFREHGGPTSLANLISVCRTCHNLIHRHGWRATLHADGRFEVRRGRYRFTTRPRHRPPPGGTGNDPPIPGGPVPVEAPQRHDVREHPTCTPDRRPQARLPF